MRIRWKTRKDTNRCVIALLSTKRILLLSLRMFWPMAVSQNIPHGSWESMARINTCWIIYFCEVARGKWLVYWAYPKDLAMRMRWYRIGIIPAIISVSWLNYRGLHKMARLHLMQKRRKRRRRRKIIRDGHCLENVSSKLLSIWTKICNFSKKGMEINTLNCWAEKYRLYNVMRSMKSMMLLATPSK